MTMQFSDIAARAAADGEITPDEILTLRRAGWGDGRMTPDEVEAIFLANDQLASASREWTDFFVEAIGEFVVNQLEPKGYVTPQQGDWLIERIDHDGKLDSLSELELLVRVFERAESTPEKLRDFALRQIETAVLTGTGPTRNGDSLDAGSINDVEAKLLRRMIFASGGDRPAAVSQAEAEMLYRIKDATLGAANSPEWKRLFVQGVGNFLQGYQSHSQLDRTRAAELEAFMNAPSRGIGGFMAAMLKSDVRTGIKQATASDPVRDRFGEADADAAVTGNEELWLNAHNNADNQIDELEQALLAFLAEETARL